MWPLPPLKKELISLFLDQNNLVCAWIRAQGKHTPPTLRAYQRIALDNVCNETSITNPSIIAKHINRFLSHYKLRNTFATLAIAPPHVRQEYITLAHATPKPTDFVSLADTRKQTCWEYDYLYPTDTNEYTFYLCGVNYPTLLQYKLIAMRTPLNLLTITTQDMALLRAYQHMYGDAFRKAQLAIDMTAQKNKPLALFTDEAIRRIMHIPQNIQINVTHEKPFLLTTAGLHFAQGIK